MPTQEKSELLSDYSGDRQKFQSCFTGPQLAHFIILARWALLRARPWQLYHVA